MKPRLRVGQLIVSKPFDLSNMIGFVFDIEKRGDMNIALIFYPHERHTDYNCDLLEGYMARGEGWYEP